ncbi:MAG TPA: DUF4270 family protein [Prolixibacteraceae bacterium]
MKKTQKVMYKFVAGFALILMTLWGCKDELNKTGFDLLLPGDLVSARKVTVDKSTIKSYTVSDELLRTNKPEYNLLGTYNDPVFGKTTADFACQFRLKLREIPDYSKANFDSLTLTLFYIESFGDTVTQQSLKIHELTSDLNGDDIFKYYQNIDLKGMSSDEVLAEKLYVPKAFKLFYDSTKTTVGSTLKTPKDTVIHEIVFRLDPSLGHKIMNIQLQGLEFPNDTLLKYFKGLYVEAGELSQGGGIMRVRPLAGDSDIKLYYHTATDTTFVSYKVKTSSARTSRFEHYGYANTDFKANLDKLDQQDKLIYLQTTGGLSSKIYIPSLSNWTDSVNCAINKAELILHVDESLIDTLLRPAPQRILLTLMDRDASNKEIIFDAKGNLIFPADRSFSEAYYGGYYNKADGTYRFNLAKHMQQLIKGQKKNYGFYLTTSEKNSIFSRVALKGATSDTGILFEITYSKIK